MKTLVLLFVFNVAWFASSAGQCFETYNKVNHVVCFSDNLKAGFDEFDVPWNLEYGQERYEAVTAIKHPFVITVFRTEVSMEVVVHEVSHIVDHLGLEGEKAADYAGKQSAIIYNTIIYYNIPLYTTIRGKKYYFTNND